MDRSSKNDLKITKYSFQAQYSVEDKNKNKNI